MNPDYTISRHRDNAPCGPSHYSHDADTALCGQKPGGRWNDWWILTNDGTGVATCPKCRKLNPVAETDDARDAARYRFLREMAYRSSAGSIEMHFVTKQNPDWPAGQHAFEDFDCAVDCARKSNPKIP